MLIFIKFWQEMTILLEIFTILVIGLGKTKPKVKAIKIEISKNREGDIRHSSVSIEKNKKITLSPKTETIHSIEFLIRNI